VEKQYMFYHPDITNHDFILLSHQDANKNPANDTNDTDDVSSQPVKKKVQRGRVPTTRSQTCQKQNASRPALYRVGN
jgi:hypothetical protein